MFIKDPNDYAIILLGIKDPTGVFYFPSNCMNSDLDIDIDLKNYWGLFFKIDSRTAVEEQIIKTVLAYTDCTEQDIKDLNICSNFRSTIYIGSTPISLYLVLKEKVTKVLEDKNYKKITDIIKDLPNNKNRISYMFIVQYLSSLNLDDLTATEVSEADLSKYFDQKN